ncbi:hypothetical protein [Mangrovicoccus ximenensis]|uniref:hypothetical protein n=1 Tax=Mangrovicoccus ximenensis TaxID=1911570 RepID=UPI000D3A1EB2|nr:hypothetical protein [Mangrovicoccus ximenensis]
MRIADIHAAIACGDLVPVAIAPIAALAAVEQLALFEGLAVPRLGLASPGFARAYPAELPERLEPVIGAGRYRTWRNCILDLQMQAAPGDTDGDPWRSLKRAADLDFRPYRNKGIYAADLQNVLPPGTRPGDVTAELLSAAADAVPQRRRQAVRQKASAFRSLYKGRFCRAAGLLPLHCPDALPASRHHAGKARMAPAIAALRASRVDKRTRLAIAYVNRLGVLAGRLDGWTDTLETLAGAIPLLPDEPVAPMPATSQETRRIYFTAVISALGISDPRLPFAEQAWHALRKAAREAGLATDCLWVLARFAIERAMPPCHVTGPAAEELAANLTAPDKRHRALIACEQLDAMRGVLPAHLLPPEPLGVRRKPVRAKPPAPPKDPAREAAAAAWKELYAQLRSLGWEGGNAFNNLSALKKFALEHGLGPTGVTQSWVDQLLAAVPDRYRGRIRAAVGEMRQLRKTTELALPDLESRTVRATTRDDPLPETVSAQFEPLLASMGLSASTERSIRFAIRTVCASRAEGITLRQILELDPADIAWPGDQARQQDVARAFGSFRAFLLLPWSNGWFRLQLAIVAAEIPRKSNPVPLLLRHLAAEDLEPKELDLAWAQRVDRQLRSTVIHPPHGRADLALTFARHVGLLDELHNHPGIVRSGLLPPVIGQIR